MKTHKTIRHINVLSHIAPLFQHRAAFQNRTSGLMKPEWGVQLQGLGPWAQRKVGPGNLNPGFFFSMENHFSIFVPKHKWKTRATWLSSFLASLPAPGESITQMQIVNVYIAKEKNGDYFSTQWWKVAFRWFHFKMFLCFLTRHTVSQSRMFLAPCDWKLLLT